MAVFRRMAAGITCILLSVVAHTLTSAEAFVFDLPSARTTTYQTQSIYSSYKGLKSKSRSNTRSLLESVTSNDDISMIDGSQSKEVFLLSYDGIIVHDVSKRVDVAIETAFQIWPELHSYVPSDSDDMSWLKNKMKDLSHITSNNGKNDGFLGCDDVLLTRLLLEEQQLDNKRSVGKSGKYASKYHPQKLSSSSSNNNDDDDDNSNDGSTTAVTTGSRPLTVGEIAENWIDLRETLRFRYFYVNEKNKKADPIPVIREKIINQNSHSTKTSLIPNNSIKKSLLNSSDNDNKQVYILLGHPSQHDNAIHTLQQLLFNTDDISTETIETDEYKQSVLKHEKSSILVNLISPVDIEQKQIHVLENLFFKYSVEKTSSSDVKFYLIHSSISVLNDAKEHLLDGSSPFTIYEKQKTKIGNDNLHLSLLFPTFCDNISPKQIREAEMDPYIDMVDLYQFSDLFFFDDLDGPSISADSFQ